jgi:nicotinamide phosphoribosyltransferase
MSKETNPLLLTDFYKISHYQQYPKGTEIVYSNLTARKSMIKGIDKVVFFGLQYFIKKYLIDYFDEHFFKKDKESIINDYSRRIRTSLGADLPNYKHIEDLHDLGYLPLEIKALPEGSLVNLRVPMLTIKNTKPEFFWLTNFIESFMSCFYGNLLHRLQLHMNIENCWINMLKKQVCQKNLYSGKDTISLFEECLA